MSEDYRDMFKLAGELPHPDPLVPSSSRATERELAERLIGAAGKVLLGGYLRLARTKLGMSLRNIEAKTGGEVSNAYLSQLESGKIAKPSPQILYALARALEVDYQHLMELAGYPAPSPLTADPNDPRHIDRKTPHNQLLRKVAELEAALTTEREKLAGLVEAAENAVKTLTDKRLSQWAYVEGPYMHIDQSQAAGALAIAIAAAKEPS